MSEEVVWYYLQPPSRRPKATDSDLAAPHLLPRYTVYKILLILSGYHAGLHADRGVCRLPLVPLGEGKGEPLVDGAIGRVPHALDAQPHLMTWHSRNQSNLLEAHPRLEARSIVNQTLSRMASPFSVATWNAHAYLCTRVKVGIGGAAWRRRVTVTHRPESR